MGDSKGSAGELLGSACRHLLDLIPDSVLIVDRSSRIVHLNRLAEGVLGFDRAGIVGQSFAMLLPARDPAMQRQFCERHFHHATPREMGREAALLLVHRTGREIPVDISIQPWETAQGGFLLAAVRDMTRHTQREDALRVSEERFALAVRGSTDGIWDWNVLTDEVYYSARFKELLGCADHEMENVFASFEFRLFPDDVERVRVALREHFEEHKPYDIEYRLRTKLGEYRWFRARGQAIWDGQDRPTRMAGSISDITEQKRSQQRFELAVRASPVALLIVDRRGTIRLVNAQLEHCFQYDAGELIGKPLEMLLPKRFRSVHRRHRDQYFRAPVSRTMGVALDLFGRRRDGSEFPVEVGLRPMETEEEMLVICGIADVTDRQQAMDAMQDAKEAAESANQAKSDFLANMSHEIRTPLNAVMGMTELVLDTELTTTQREYLGMVMEAGDLLLTIINEILDFSKIEAGRVELDCRAFSVRDLVGDTLRALAPRAHRRELELAYVVDKNVPDQLFGDANRLRQIILNLVGNAIKFTESGEVLVRLESTARTPDDVLLRWRVIDTGIGIAEAKQALIFEAFAQSDTSTTRHYGGTGLGLTICSKLIDLMGGGIWVESKPGQGSTFSFSVRLRLATSQEASETARYDALKGIVVLVVDDNHTSRTIIHEILQHWGMQPISVDSATAALATLLEYADDGRPIPVVVTDVTMPGVDGFVLCEQIRNAEELASTELICLSASDRAGDLARYEQLGIWAHLLKPVKPSELGAILVGIATKNRPQKVASFDNLRPVPVPARRSLQILLAEDSLMNQKLVIGLLGKLGHVVEVVSTGRAAVVASEKRSFDLILMDVQMPEMNGLEATRHIRRREAKSGKHVPIIALTAHALKGDRDQCLSAGMDGYVAKPVRHRDLLQAIEESLAGTEHDRA